MYDGDTSKRGGDICMHGRETRTHGGGMAHACLAITRHMHNACMAETWVWVYAPLMHGSRRQVGQLRVLYLRWWDQSQDTDLFQNIGALSLPLAQIASPPQLPEKEVLAALPHFRSLPVAVICPQPPPAGAGKRGINRTYAASPSEPAPGGILKVCGGEGSGSYKGGGGGGSCRAVERELQRGGWSCRAVENWDVSKAHAPL